MNNKIFDSLGTYWMVYQYLSGGSKSKEEVNRYLKENGKSTTTAKDHTKKAWQGALPFISFENNLLTLDRLALTDFMKEFASQFQYEATFEPKSKKKKKPEDEYTAVTDSHSPVFRKQKSEANQAKSRVQELENEIKQLKQNITKLKKKNMEKLEDAVLECIDSKVLVLGSAKVQPPEKFQNDFFESSPGKLINVETMISSYGGEVDSFYDASKDKCKELTVPNYVKWIASQLFNGKLLERKADEQNVVSTIHSIDDCHVSKKMEKKRLESVNEILAMEDVSNQLKLSLYAAWFNGSDPEMVELLNYAGEQDINANYVIKLFEKPKDYRNYRTIRGLLQQAKKASEAHIKRQAAIELISGEWFVEAEYRGELCQFKMMPVNEMQAFKELLEKHQTEMALDVMDQMLMDKRNACFKDSDSGKQILVTNEKDKAEDSNRKEKKDVQIPSPSFLHEQEKKSGVNCHPKIDEDDAYEAFSEAEEKGDKNGKK